MNCTCEPPHCPLVHAGHDDGHLGPETTKRSTAQGTSSKPSKPSLAHAEQILLVHTDISGLKTEKETQREVQNSQENPTLHMQLPGMTTIARIELSFWSITAMMQGILGLATPEGNIP